MKNTTHDYEEQFNKCETSLIGHAIRGQVYPFNFAPTEVGFCSNCGNILETYDGIHFLWIHRTSGKIFTHFEMRF